MKIRTKWLEFCNLKAVLKFSTFLCSNHFIEKDYLLTATTNKEWKHIIYLSYQK